MDKQKTVLKEKEYTDSFLTKQGKTILLIIFLNPGICSSEIADKLNIAKNSMSNALERLKTSQYPLIRYEQQGRKKLYFLTDWGTEYTSNYLNKPELIEKHLKNTNNSSQEIEHLAKKALDALVDMKHIDNDWQFILSDYLENDHIYTNVEMSDLINQFLQSLKEIFTLDDENTYKKILSEISCIQPRIKLENYIKKECSLLSLWNWSQDSWFDAYNFVDEFFTKNLTALYEMIENQAHNGLSRNTIQQIIIGLSETVNSARKEKFDKIQFYNFLISQYPHCDEKLAFYIAEKYKELETTNICKK